MPKDTNYVFEANKLVLKPGEHWELKIAFCPKTLGPHNKHLTFKFCNFSVKIIVVGTCIIS